MLKAPILANEFERLKALLELEILDTTPEIDLDEITAIASKICETPLALVSIVDCNRQWFKSKVGLGASETPRDISFCGHAIQQNDVFCVENALEDPRFFDNPLTTGEPRVIFYAGAPLKTQSGQNIGTLCVIDHRARKLTELQNEVLKLLSRQIMNYIEMKKYQTLQAKAFEGLVEATKTIQRQQEAMIQSSKLAIVGELSASIAHEINNPLAIISSSALSLLRKDTSEHVYDNETVKKLQTIQRTAFRISEITKGLTQYSRSDQLDQPMFCIPVKTIIRDCVILSEEFLRKQNVTLSCEIEDRLRIECRSVQIGQCIFNLIRNSVDAIANQEEKWIKVSAKTIGDDICVRVTDSGSGIRDKIVLEKMMLPFFTTKETGKGTGLGLSIVKGIMQSHGGDLTYDATSENTSFCLIWPKRQAKSMRVPA